MAKNNKVVKGFAKFKVKGGAATPALGAVLGQHGIQIMEFCKQFNAITADRKGETVPVKMTIYEDRTFSFVIKTPPASNLILERAKVKKGASNPGKEVAGTIRWADIEEVAKIKMPDLNANDIDAAKKIVAGSARSMGLNIVD
ncbi:50S ribosomal protein L11 [Candidatus Babeliales bacterium]|nr:50S ribosomal protein L11 [Candidatus Babeliales bacterium]